jgi:hypothetical protein
MSDIKTMDRKIEEQNPSYTNRQQIEMKTRSQVDQVEGSRSQSRLEGNRLWKRGTHYRPDHYSSATELERKLPASARETPSANTHNFSGQFFFACFEKGEFV